MTNISKCFSTSSFFPSLKSVQQQSARLFIFAECWHSPCAGGCDLDEVTDHREDISHLKTHITRNLDNISNPAQMLAHLASQTLN